MVGLGVAEIILLLLVATLLIPLYLVPTIIAAVRRDGRVAIVILVNVFLGWTVIGWVVALRWALGKDQDTFKPYLRKAHAELRRRQDKLREEYRLSAWERYDWHQETEELVFSQDGKAKVVAKVQFVGSVSQRSKTWRWAWANDTMLPGTKRDVLGVRALGQERGWHRLVTPQWAADEGDGWDMTAVAVYALGATGAYRSPDEDGFTFMAIMGMKWAAEAGDREAPEATPPFAPSTPEV